METWDEEYYQESDSWAEGVPDSTYQGDYSEYYRDQENWSEPAPYSEFEPSYPAAHTFETAPEPWLDPYPEYSYSTPPYQDHYEAPAASPFYPAAQEYFSDSDHEQWLENPNPYSESHLDSPFYSQEDPVYYPYSPAQSRRPLYVSPCQDPKPQRRCYSSLSHYYPTPSPNHSAPHRRPQPSSHKPKRASSYKISSSPHHSHFDQQVKTTPKRPHCHSLTSNSSPCETTPLGDHVQEIKEGVDNTQGVYKSIKDDIREIKEIVADLIDRFKKGEFKKDVGRRGKRENETEMVSKRKSVESLERKEERNERKQEGSSMAKNSERVINKPPTNPSFPLTFVLEPPCFSSLVVQATLERGAEIHLGEFGKQMQPFLGHEEECKREGVDMGNFVPKPPSFSLNSELVEKKHVHVENLNELLSLGRKQSENLCEHAFLARKVTGCARENKCLNPLSMNFMCDVALDVNGTMYAAFTDLTWVDLYKVDGICMLRLVAKLSGVRLVFDPGANARILESLDSRKLDESLLHVRNGSQVCMFEWYETECEYDLVKCMFPVEHEKLNADLNLKESYNLVIHETEMQLHSNALFNLELLDSFEFYDNPLFEEEGDMSLWEINENSGSFAPIIFGQERRTKRKCTKVSVADFVLPFSNFKTILWQTEHDHTDSEFPLLHFSSNGLDLDCKELGLNFLMNEKCVAVVDKNSGCEYAMIGVHFHFLTCFPSNCSNRAHMLVSRVIYDSDWLEDHVRSNSECVLSCCIYALTNNNCEEQFVLKFDEGHAVKLFCDREKHLFLGGSLLDQFDLGLQDILGWPEFVFDPGSCSINLLGHVWCKFHEFLSSVPYLKLDSDVVECAWVKCSNMRENAPSNADLVDWTVYKFLVAAVPLKTSAIVLNNHDLELHVALLSIVKLSAAMFEGPSDKSKSDECHTLSVTDFEGTLWRKLIENKHVSAVHTTTFLSVCDVPYWFRINIDAQLEYTGFLVSILSRKVEENLLICRMPTAVFKVSIFSSWKDFVAEIEVESLMQGTNELTFETFEFKHLNNYVGFSWKHVLNLYRLLICFVMHIGTMMDDAEIWYC